jgi:hypothetical protein
MSRAAIGARQEFRRPLAARLMRCVRGATIRLAMVSVALVTGIFPGAARSPQIQSFHPLYPTRPPRAVSGPAAAKPASGMAKRMGKLTPEDRKRMAAAMSRRILNQKASQAKKSVR